MKNKRALHGAISTLITAGVLVLVILLNVVTTLLFSGGLGFIDFTKENLYRISDESRKLLDEMDPEKNNITIYFLADPDELGNVSLHGNSQDDDTSDWGMRYVYEMANLFASEYSFIKVDTLDLKKDAELIRTVYSSTIATTFDKLDVIIDNCTDGVTHNFRVVSRDAFFTFDSSTSTLYAANGDYKYTSTILSLSGTVPTAYFVTGHGEEVGDPDDDSDFGKAQAMAELFVEAGFNPVKIDLSKEDFRPDNEDSLVNGSSVVVIYGPKTDFSVDFGQGNENKVNEITKLRKYINAKNHHLMVFKDTNVGVLDSLEEYLYDFWGVEFSQNMVIADTSDERTSVAISDDGKTFTAEYETDETSIGVSLTASLLDNLDSIPDMYFKNAGTVKLREDYTSPNGFYEKERTATLFAGSVFNAPGLSSAIYKDGRIEAYDKSVYDIYYDKYADSLREAAEKHYTSAEMQSEIKESVTKVIRDKYVGEKYTKLYTDAYNKLYDEKYEANIAAGLAENDAKKGAGEYASEEIIKLNESLMDEAEAYADGIIVSDDGVKEIKEETEKTVKKLIDSYVDDQISYTQSGSLMTLTYERWSNELTNNKIPTYVLACGTTEFANKDIIESATYGNRDTLYYAMRLMGKEILPFEIDFIVLRSEALDTSKVNTTAVLVAMSVIPAALAVTAGIIVLIKRRKHS